MLHLELRPETEQFYRHLAHQVGITSESYLQRILEAMPPSPNPICVKQPKESLDEAIEAFVRDLPPMAPFPADFSRADIYAGIWS